MNPISEVVLGNAVDAIAGMVSCGPSRIDTMGECYIAATLMGITNDTVMLAVDELEKKGKRTISFHSTGMGGRVMEELVEETAQIAILSKIG